ncbi:MAG: cytochrome c-type biogenesis protein [Pseudomonadales bacterium]
MRLLLPTLLIFFLVYGNTSFAAEDAHTFANSQQLERFQYFVKNLRCPMCDNQNLEGSNSAISADLRDELARMISDGKTDQQINEFMRARYGDFIFYKPPLDRKTLWLWVMPLLLGVVALLVLLRLARSKNRLTENSVSADDRARAQRLLEQQETE